jgi:hypothetical protein
LPEANVLSLKKFPRSMGVSLQPKGGFINTQRQARRHLLRRERIRPPNNLRGNYKPFLLWFTVVVQN